MCNKDKIKAMMSRMMATAVSMAMSLIMMMEKELKLFLNLANVQFDIRE